MLGTAFLDKFRAGEQADVLRGIRELTDYGTWSPFGLYCFWDPSNHEVLYIGLDSHLGNRFAMHTGLVRAGPGASKWPEIESWFTQYEVLGISFVLQTGVGLDRPGRAHEETSGGMMKAAEGQMIEGVKLRTGDLPPWNRIGGSALGQASALSADHSIHAYDRVLTGFVDSLLAARQPIRVLGQSNGFEYFEEILHAGRISAGLGGTDDVGIINGLRMVLRYDDSGFARSACERMLETQYLEVRPIDSAVRTTPVGVRSGAMAALLQETAD